MNDNFATVMVYIIVGAILLTVFWVIPSAFEARAFNNVTGKNVSTLDAMFINLRVSEGSSD